MTIDQTASGIHRRAGVATQVFGHWDMSYHEGTIADACWRVVCEMLGGREGEGRGEKSKRRGGGQREGLRSVQATQTCMATCPVPFGSHGAKERDGVPSPPLEPF